MTFVKKVATLASTASAMLMAAPVVLAQDASEFFTPIEMGEGGANFKITDFGVLLQGLLNTVLFISALLVFGYLVWGGIQWITSGGDKGKTEEARNKITAAIVGLAVVAASYAIFRVVLFVLGINDPFTTLPDQIRLY